MSTLTTRDLGTRFRSAFAQDTAQTGGRGAPNAISPASDSENYALAGGGSGTWSIIAGSPSEIQFTGATNPAYALLGSGTTGNVDILVRFAVSATGDGAGVVLRYSGVNSHYRVRYSSATLTIVLDNAGTATSLASTAFTLTASSFYWIRAKAIGSYLFGKIWSVASSEPDWMVTTTDSTFVSGQYGLFANLGGSIRTAQYDSFSVADGGGLSVPHDIGTRFLLQAVSPRDLGSRFRLFAAPTTRDLSSRFRSAISQDTAQTDSRGAPAPNNISPASDGENYSLFGGNGGSWSWVSGTPNELQFTLSTNPAYAILGSHIVGDYDMAVRLTVSATGDGAGMVFRYSSVNNHYRVRYQSGAFALLLDSAGTVANLASTVFTLTPGSFYWIRAKAIGPYLFGKMWADGSTEPDWMVTATDTTLTMGQFGLFANLGGPFRTAQYDSFSVSNGVGLNVPRAIFSRFVLQATRPRDLGTRFRLRGVSRLRDVSTRFRLQPGPPERDIFTRFRLQSQPRLRDLASRFRLQVVVPRDLKTRFLVAAVRPRDLSSRFRVQSQPRLRDLASRFRLQIFQVPSIRHISTRFVLGAPPPPPPPAGPPPPVAGFAGSGQVYPILVPPESVYAVNGTVLSTQPYLCTAPLSEGAGTLPMGTTFLLLFNSPDSPTQALLSSTLPVSLSFYLPSGELVTAGQVRLTHTVSGSTYQVTATLLAPFSINVWVVTTQFL